MLFQWIKPPALQNNRVNPLLAALILGINRTMTNFLLAIFLAIILVFIANKVSARDFSTTVDNSTEGTPPPPPTAASAVENAAISAEAVINSVADQERKVGWLKEQEKIPFAISDDNKCAAYLGDMKRRIKRAWLPPSRRDGKAATVTFILGANGKISDLVLKQSSGDDSFDRSAMTSVQIAVPYTPLPIEAPSKINVVVIMDGNDYRGFHVNPKFVGD